MNFNENPLEKYKNNPEKIATFEDLKMAKIEIN